MSAVRGETAPRPVLYVRVPVPVRERLGELALEENRTLSATTERVLERGLAYDENAVHALLSWCWRMTGHLEPELSDAFTEAIKRCELALGFRKA